jgi:probable rRNA maturation factor
MVTIKNDQSIPVNSAQLQSDAEKILTHLGYADFDLGILLTTNQTMHEYNKKYRDKDKSTDILSFPFYPDLNADEKITAEKPEQKNLGDIIIAPEYVKDDLERWGQSFDERMRTLLIHGICHLLGYDHINDDDYEVMKVKEKELRSIVD